MAIRMRVGSFGRLEGHAAANPGDDGFVGFRARLETLTAAVIDGHGGLEQNQAFFRRAGKDATAAGFLHDFGVIGFRIVTENGKFKAVLAFGFGVARTGHATGFGHHRQNVMHE